MKVFFITIFCFSLLKASAQDYQNDWADFNNAHWRVSFKNERFDFLKRPVQGVMYLTGNIDTDRSEIYYVYRKEDFVQDSALRREVINWYIVQNCESRSGLNFELQSFYYKNYYYLRQFCGGCNVEVGKECEYLAKRLRLYVNRKE